MDQVTNAQIEEFRVKARELSASLPTKKPRSVESRIVESLFSELETLKSQGHSWPSIAERFGKGVRWRSLQSSFARSKKLRSKSKKSSPVAPPAPSAPPQHYIPPSPKPMPLPPGLINNR